MEGPRVKAKVKGMKSNQSRVTKHLSLLRTHSNYFLYSQRAYTDIHTLSFTIG